jgi:hypothetical protein
MPANPLILLHARRMVLRWDQCDLGALNPSQPRSFKPIQFSTQFSALVLAQPWQKAFYNRKRLLAFAPGFRLRLLLRGTPEQRKRFPTHTLTHVRDRAWRATRFPPASAAQPDLQTAGRSGRDTKSCCECRADKCTQQERSS